MKKTKYLMTRVSEEEKKTIEKAGNEEGFNSSSGYVRKTMLDRAKKVLKNVSKE